ncbi:MAG: tRNA (adenosine(37)-N6)-dimethylallyltransferase MiaA [Bacteroidaceae bacterium]
MNTLVVLLGPTGAGKTELSLSLAEFFHIPIINCDSRQLFRDLKIGTAAPTPDEQKRVKHYFVGTLALDEYYSAAQYEIDVMKLLQEQFQTKPIALLSGGSMLYIDAVCKGIDDIPTVDSYTRQMLQDRYAKEGLENLCNELQQLDPSYYKEVDRCNPKRVIHALEICKMTGKPYSSFRNQVKPQRPFQILKIGLQREREELYKRINARVDKMIENGLIEEVKRVYPYRSFNSLNTVGYKELFNYLDGEWTLDFAIEKIKQNSRIYSRKQTTWYRKDETIIWLNPDDIDNIRNIITNKLMNKQ